MRELLHQAPTDFGLTPSRWTLALIRRACSVVSAYSLSGIWRVLQALGFHLKRGQQHVRSPDPEYISKRDRAAGCVAVARTQPGEVITLYLDEFTYTRWPTVAAVYHERGRCQPTAELTAGYNTRGRIVAVLDVVSGRVLYRQCSQVTVGQLVGLMEDIRQAYPQAHEIHVIQDNWHNVHFHPNQVAAAEKLGITLVPLPTYASWLNPIEKLGRKLKQEIVHMHRQSDDWPALKQRVAGFLDQFAAGSSDLLRYVGLLPV